MAYADFRSMTRGSIVASSLFIFNIIVRVYVFPLFYTMLSVLSSFTIILKGKGELTAIMYFSCLEPLLFCASSSRCGELICSV